MNDSFVHEIEEDGFAIVPGLITPESADRLISDLDANTHAIRNLLQAVPSVARLAQSSTVRAPVERILGANCFAVRGIFFDKTPTTNWKVTWHQDLTIAVHERLEVPGFGASSEKAGVTHVQPPVDFLARMLTLRAHLDDCGPENGPLRVVPGSHVSRRIDPQEISEWCRERGERMVTLGRGEALLMRPLLLHASSEAITPAHRRVIHLEFAAEDLPCGLEWHGRW
jgi:ectoine hydroxylase-related dioxygenase (phytanoyl-CoA dioxygenase family)